MSSTSTMPTRRVRRNPRSTIPLAPSNLVRLDTPYAHAHRWLRVLHHLEFAMIESVEEARGFEAVAMCALDAVQAWGTPGMLADAAGTCAIVLRRLHAAQAVDAGARAANDTRAA